MKIAILTPRPEFSVAQQQALDRLGTVAYTDSRRAYPLSELARLCDGSHILAFDPDNIGGFEVSHDRLLDLAASLPNLQGIALSTTAFGYIDLPYFRRRGLVVTNVPHYSSESVAEHALCLLLGCAKRVFLTDRLTQKDAYRLVEGRELSGKTLGIIGLGDIGTRMAQLAQGIGMNVIAWNRSPKRVKGVSMTSLEQVVKNSDAISLHLAENQETLGILSSRLISQLKRSVIIVNTADRELVAEKAMARALKSGRVDSYALEAEDLTSPPLGNLENAFLFRGFGWYTQEALARNKEIWVNNILGIARQQPLNQVL